MAVRLQKAPQAGSEIPNTLIGEIPWAPELAKGDVCGVPTFYKTHDAWKGKKVVVVSIPGAYTPVCHQHHIPPLVKRVNEIKSKGVDEVYVIAVNDPFVQAAWGIYLGAKDELHFATDVNLEFSKAVRTVALLLLTAD